jgi:hypothetical protein
MQRGANIVLGITVIVATWLAPLHAQTGAYTEEGDDNPKINSNLGVPVIVPVSTTADVANTGAGISAGVGGNFNRRNAFVGELLWSRVFPNSDQLAPLRAVLQGAGGLDGTTDLFVISGNYRFELRGKLLGTYLIGGPGWYHRNSSLTRTVTTGTATTCTPVWFWWGFTCSNGVVTANQTLASSGASSWGVNGGAGVTVRVGEAPYRLYFESRYHYAPSTNIKMQFIVVTVGIRY